MTRTLTIPVRGQVLALVAVLLPLFLTLIGLVVDAGIVLGERRALQNLADAAARAGASEVSETVLRETDGQRVMLDEVKAQSVATGYLAAAPRPIASAIVSAELDGVTVQTTRDVQLSFLTLLGFDGVLIQATASSRVRYGITGESS